MATIFGHSPLATSQTDPNTGEGYYMPNVANAAQTLQGAGFVQTGILLSEDGRGGTQPDGTSPEVWHRDPDATGATLDSFTLPAASDLPAGWEAGERGILARSIARVTSGTPWTKSSFTAQNALDWAAAHPHAQAFAVFKS